MTTKQMQELNTIAKKHELKLIVLYGSCARGSAHEGSDIDIAISRKTPIDFKTYTDLHADLGEALGSPDMDIDLVTLEGKDPLFLYHIARNSQLLVGDLTEYNEFRAAAFKGYFDSRDLFRLEAKLVARYQQYLDLTYA